jgi:hypothetical protein
MSATAATLSQSDYDERKRFLDELKSLSKSEQEEIFRILKSERVEFSENSNGVFFDLCKVPQDSFIKFQKFMEFCRKNREEFAAREEQEKEAKDALFHDP